MKDKNKGVLLMLIAAFFYALIAANVKWIEGIPVFEKLFFRTFFGLVICLVILCKNKTPIGGNNHLGLIGRGLTGLISTFLYYIALSHAPMAETVTLSNLYPFLLAVLCFLFLGEKLHWYHLAALCLSFAGAVFIVRPGFHQINFYYIVALLSALFMAITYTFLKKVRETDQSEVIVLWYSSICCLGCIPMMFFEQPVIPSLFQFFQLICLGVVATVFQLLMTAAYRYAPASELSIYSYSSIIFSAVLGFIIWGEVPVIFTVIGVVLILIGAYVIFRGENLTLRQHQHRQSK